MAGFKSDENKQLFIKGLREANFTQEEIDREVQDIEGAPAKVAPTDSAPPPAKKEDAVVNQPSPFALDTTAPARQLKEMDQAREEQGKTLVNNLTPTGGFFPPSKENWPVYALPAAAAAVTAAGLGLKSRFFGPEKEAGARVEPTSSDRLPAAAQQPTTHEQWIANLSPEEKTLYERSEEAKTIRANALESTRTEPFLEPERPVVAPQTPEQIRQARLAANAQVAQQSMVAAPPPEAAPLQKVEPPTERPANPKVPALLQPPMAGAVAPEPVPAVPVEPVATPAAEPVATTKETPAAPVATDAERVKTIQATEEPKAKPVTTTETPSPLTKKEQAKLDKSLLAGKNQYEQQLGGKSFPEQFKKSWDVLTEHVFSEGPPKGQGGSPQYWEKAQAFMKANPDKFPSETLKHIKQLAEKYGKPTDQAGFARLGSMAGLGSTALAGLLITPSIMAAKKSAQEGDIGMAASHASNVLNLHPFGMLGNMLFGTSPEELQTLRENDKARKTKAGNAATSRK
jgi:hypothetical protein